MDSLVCDDDFICIRAGQPIACWSRYNLPDNSTGTRMKVGVALCRCKNCLIGLKSPVEGSNCSQFSCSSRRLRDSIRWIRVRLELVSDSPKASESSAAHRASFPLSLPLKLRASKSLRSLQVSKPGSRPLGSGARLRPEALGARHFGLV